jgi:hypothetical protein
LRGERSCFDFTLEVIIIFTFYHDESQAGIALIGGVEAMVKVMQAFPKCRALQEGRVRRPV